MLYSSSVLSFVITLFTQYFTLSVFISNAVIFIEWRWRCLCDGGISDLQDGNTALMWAAEEGHADCARLLIDSGADKNVKSNVRRRSLFSGTPSRFLLFFLSLDLILHYSSPPIICLTIFVNTPIIQIYHDLYLSVSPLSLSLSRCSRLSTFLPRFSISQSHSALSIFLFV